MAMLCAMAFVENKILRRAKNMKGLEKYGVLQEEFLHNFGIIRSGTSRHT